MMPQNSINTPFNMWNRTYARVENGMKENAYLHGEDINFHSYFLLHLSQLIQFNLCAYCSWKFIITHFQL